MAQEQVNCGFSESLLQVDDNTFLRVHNRLQPEIEITTSGRKLALTRAQWEKIDFLSNNIQLAFTLLSEGQITTINENKRKKPSNDTFNDLIEGLGL